MSDYKIEKNVEIPGGITKNRYSFNKMEIGDSFLFETAKRANVSTASSTFGKRNNIKFTIRKIDNKHCRCWRIK